MLTSVLNLVKSPIVDGLIIRTLKNKLCLSNVSGVMPRFMHITSTNLGSDRRTLTASAPRKDEGADGEKVVDIDHVLKSKDMFPDMYTPTKLFNGIPFKEIPIVNIKCTPNNTLMTVTNHDGLVRITHTCGSEGFKHARKGTNVAAQATAISLSAKALEKGYKTVRVRVRGLGPGRASAIKGLQMGGMEIISITDSTRVSWCPPRPRKAKRL